MSTSGVTPIRPTGRPTPEQIKAERKKAARRSDILYVTGAAMIAAGAGWFGIRYAFFTAGFFCVLLPMLELTGSFIRGIQPKRQ